MEYKKNDILTVTIGDIGNDGEGIGKIDGFTLFVKDAVIGDVVLVKIMKAKKHYAYARLEKVLTPSPFRVKPPCAFHRQCGGCQIQAMSYERQMQFKEDKIKGNLIHIGKFEESLIDRIMEPVVGMEEAFHYRNKAQFPVGTDKEGNPIVGFYAGRTHTIIENKDCLLGVSENKEILETILGYMKREKVRAYKEETGEGLIRHILIRTGFSSKQIMVCIVINGGRMTNGRFLPQEDTLLADLKKIKNMTSISVCINRERTNVIMGKEVYTLWGEDRITDSICIREGEDFRRTGKEIFFKVSPLSFYQVNPIQTEKLYSIALDYAGLTGEETVWDLYCGIGTISLFLAQKAKKVYGVEIVPQAIRDAKENAANNGIKNVEFFVGKAEEVLPDKYEKEGEYADVIVVDPPRKGCDAVCLETMLRMKPERIVYVSCDSATLARDLRVLCDGGYELVRGRGVDQFGQTVHVETIVLLSKGEVDSKKIRVEFSLEDMDMSEFQDGATYPQIKEYVLEHTGLKVSNLYISQIKRKCGIEVGKNYNLPKAEDSRQPQCPPEKEKAIREAFKYFGMI